MSENIQYLNDDNFSDHTKNGVILVDFYADWCGPCRMIAPIIEELADHFHGKAVIAKVDIEESQGVASQLGITSIPTIILFKNGQEVKRFVGVKDAEALTDLVNSVL